MIAVWSTIAAINVVSCIANWQYRDNTRNAIVLGGNMMAAGVAVIAIIATLAGK
jgi:hypothetical protein